MDSWLRCIPPDNGGVPKRHKARVALEALRGDKTIQEIAVKHKVHPNQVSTWKRQAMDGLGAIFSNGVDKVRVDHESELHDLHAKIGQLTAGFFGQRVQAMSRGDRKAIIVRDRPDLSLSRQCRLLSIARSGLLRSQGREPGQPGADAAHRRVVPEVSGSQRGSYGAKAFMSASPSSPAHAVDGSSGHLSAAEDQRATPGASDLSLPSQEADNRPAQPGLVRRHHLHSGEPRLPVSGRDPTRHVLSWRLSNTMDAAASRH